MQERSNDATKKRPEGERTIDAPVVEIDLNKFISQVKSEESWLTNTRNSITVFKSDAMRIVLVGLHGGEELDEQVDDGIISIQVLEGYVVFKANGEDQKLLPGKMAVLHEHIPFNVTAVLDSIFLLTMALKK